MLYSKKAISILSLLISPFFASFLFAANLRDIGKPSLGPLFVIASVFFAGMIKKLLPDVPPIILFVSYNIVSSGLFYFYLFDKYFGEYEYEKKNFWPPTIFFISIIAILLLAIYLKKIYLGD